jgi:hypothetical protein
MQLKKIHFVFFLLFVGFNLSAQTHQKKWTLDKNNNMLQKVKISKSAGRVDIIYLKFSGKNRKLLPLFTTMQGNLGVYAKTLKTDALPLAGFTGEVEGVDAKGRLRFQVLFWNGLRYGEFLTVSEKGDTQKLNFPKSPAQIQEENPPMPINPHEDVSLKPIIYLYPAAPTAVNVRVKTGKNTLTHTYPKYNPATGWQVVAQPNGDLVDAHTKKEYYALFWEAKNAEPFEFSEGFSVAGAETANFLDTKLAELGLNRREANEFIMFWLPRMENNPYNVIHFAAEDYTNRFPLEISPRPDALIRVYMVFRPAQEPVKIPAQVFDTPKRTGFTVVEWGGTEQPEQEK